MDLHLLLDKLNPEQLYQIVLHKINQTQGNFKHGLSKYNKLAEKIPQSEIPKLVSMLPRYLQDRLESVVHQGYGLNLAGNGFVLAGQRGRGLPSSIRKLIQKIPQTAERLAENFKDVRVVANRIAERAKGIDPKLVLSGAMRIAGIDIPANEMKDAESLFKYLKEHPEQVENIMNALKKGYEILTHENTATVSGAPQPVVPTNIKRPINSNLYGPTYDVNNTISDYGYTPKIINPIPTPDMEGRQDDFFTTPGSGLPHTYFMPKTTYKPIDSPRGFDPLVFVAKGSGCCCGKRNGQCCVRPSHRKPYGLA